MKIDHYQQTATSMHTTPQRLEVKGSKQLDFLHQLTDGQCDYSQSVNIWDTSPRFFYGRQSHLRENGKYLASLQRTMVDGAIEYGITIRPARINTKDGREIERYPGEIEEHVEFGLRKLAVDGLGVSINGFYGVFFSIYQLKKLLEDYGQKYSHQQIHTALETLSKAAVDYEWQDEHQSHQLTGVNYLAVSGVSQEKNKTKAGSKERRYAIFSPFVTKGINEQTLRLYNYRRSLEYSSAAARWLEKRLVHKYRQAATNKPYHILLSSLVRDSGLGNAKDISKRLQFWNDAFLEMQGIDPKTKAAVVIDEDTEQSWPIDHVQVERQFIKRAGSKRPVLDDVKFTIYPTEKFAKEIIISNSNTKKLQAFSIIKKPVPLQGVMPEGMPKS